MDLWEILIPVRDNDTRGGTILGKEFSKEHHRDFDAYVEALAGGLTIMRPAKGKWLSRDKEPFHEEMIPVRVACEMDIIDRIVAFAAKHYSQKAMMFYRVSDYVVIRHYPK